MKWQRARKPEQKEQRRIAILESAMQLFKGYNYEEISLNAVARQSGLSKSNIYRYFESKEVIFLNILYQDTLEWAESLERELASLAKTDEIKAVARILANSIVARPRLAALMAIVSSVLEKNVSMSSALWFKTSMNQTMDGIISNIHTTLPNLTMKQASLLIHYLLVLISGMWPIANPPPVCAEIMKREEFKEISLDLSRDLEPAILTIIKGLLAN